jgi:hypothetical protein
MRTISFRLPKAHRDALNRLAAENDRSLSAELRRLIRQHVEGRQS